MVFTSEHRRFIIESYFRNSCAGLKGLCPRPGIKYYADGNSCAPIETEPCEKGSIVIEKIK
jgi:hypothetical protein